MDSGSELGKLLYCGVNLGLMAASVMLRRKAFIVFGAVGVMGYIAHLAWRVFEDALLFPFALTLLGVGIIYVGTVYQRNQRALEAWVLERLPAAESALLVKPGLYIHAPRLDLIDRSITTSRFRPYLRLTSTLRRKRGSGAFQRFFCKKIHRRSVSAHRHSLKHSMSSASDVDILDDKLWQQLLELRDPDEPGFVSETIKDFVDSLDSSMAAMQTALYVHAVEELSVNHG